jgi:hypothetical protein
MNRWTELADDEALGRAVMALRANGIGAAVAANGGEARRKVFQTIPEGAEVMTMTSVTLQDLGIAQEIDGFGRFHSVRKRLAALDRGIRGREMSRLGAAPEWTIGSVHAVTEGGSVLIASNTGSQLAAYVYGAGRVVWVVGTQKIVKDTEEGVRRIYEHCLPLETERARRAYGASGSAVNKLLTVHREVREGRITLIFVKEHLGF